MPDLEALRAAADWQISNATVYLLNERGVNAYTIHVQRGEGTTDADAEAVAQRVCAALRDRDRLLRVAEAAEEYRASQDQLTELAYELEPKKHHQVRARRRAESAWKQLCAALDAKEPSDALR